MAKYSIGNEIGKVQVRIFQHRQSTGQHIKFSLEVHMHKQGLCRTLHLNRSIDRSVHAEQSDV